MNDITRQGLLAAIILVILLIIEIAIENFAAPLTTNEIFSSEWIHYNYGSPALSFSSPKELKQVGPVIPKKLWKSLRYAESFSFKEIDNYYLTIQRIEFIFFVKGDVEKVSKEEMSDLQNKKSISHLKYKQAPYTLDKEKGIMHYGTFETNDTKFEFTHLDIQYKSSIWQIMIKYQKGDQFGKKITQKILTSMKITDL
jgi:hypothetical protein